MEHKITSQSILLRKAQRWFRLWLKTLIEEILSPISDAGALLQILPVLFIIYLAYLASGKQSIQTEILNVWAAQQTLIAILPIFIIICMVRAAILVTKNLNRLGQWHGNAFCL